MSSRLTRVAAATLSAVLLACGSAVPRVGAQNGDGPRGHPTWLMLDQAAPGRDTVPARQVPRSFARSVLYLTANLSAAVSSRRAELAFVFTSYQAFADQLKSGPIPGQVQYVAYDPEKWNATPLREQLDPTTYMKRFTRLARRHDLQPIVAPGRDLLLVHRCPRGRRERLDKAFVHCDLAAGGSGANTFVIQAAPEEASPAAYLSLVRQVSAQVRRSSPATAVLATVNVSLVPLQQLVHLVRSARRYVNGFEVNTAPSSLRTAVALIERVRA
jgi:hypothetical protein